MSPLVGRLIPRVPAVNERAHIDVRRAQPLLEAGMADAVNALVAVSALGLTRTQAEHIVRLALLHTLFAVSDDAHDVSVTDLFAGLVDRLDRECWLLDGGAQ